MADTELAEIPTQTSTAECRFRNGTNKTTTKQSLSMGKETSTDNYPSEIHFDPKEDLVDIGLIQQRAYLLSAWIGDTNRKFNRFKGWIGLVVWTINVVIHFGLDFYEAKFVFEVSWATCIGLFLVTLLACCYSMIKHSVPWFIKGVKKLQRDGHYPKTLRRVYLMFKYMPFVVVMFALGAAMGQFGCYAYDGALRLSFSKLSNETGVVIPAGIDVIFNVLRATSLTHIFYGFALILVFHMSLILMIQSSMHEFNERMGKLFRENPIQIGFPDAVNLFSARAKFVREGSRRSSVVLTTLLVACSTSFVLNAYNFLFLNRFAIYIWFALAPLIWVVAPLTGAAWVTKTYFVYKLVVVNAWVDIPEEHELDAEAHEYLHEQHSGHSAAQHADLEGKKHGETEKRTGVKNDAYRQHVTDDVISIKSKVNGTPTFRKNSDTSVCSSTDEMSTHVRASPNGTRFFTPPEILLTSYDEADDDAAGTQVLCVRGRQRSQSDSMLTALESITDGTKNAQATSSSCGNGCEKLPRSHVVIIDHEESMTSNNLSETTRHISDSTSQLPSFPKGGSLVCGGALPSLPWNASSMTRSADNSPNLSRSTKRLDEEVVCHHLKVPSLEQTADDDDGCENHKKKANLLSGIAKTFHQWRTKTKKKRKFNYEKYIIYLESILPTVGFSIGGVIITFNGIYTFIVILSFLVGVFAQEAFFGN